MTNQEKMELERQKFTTELLHEVKTNAKRWFLAFCVMIILEILTIFGFMWYISLPVEETETTYSQEADDNSYNQIIGGDYNGSQTDGKANESKENNKK